MTVQYDGQTLQLAGTESEPASRQVTKKTTGTTTTIESYTIIVAGLVQGGTDRYETTAAGELVGPLRGGRELHTLTKWKISKGGAWTLNVSCTRNGGPDREQPQHTVQHQGVDILVRYLQ